MDNNKLCGLAFNLPENKFIIVEKASRPIPVPKNGIEMRMVLGTLFLLQERKKGGKIPIPASRTKIGEKRKALNGYTKSYEIGIKSNFSALEQL